MSPADLPRLARRSPWSRSCSVRHASVHSSLRIGSSPEPSPSESLVAAHQLHGNTRSRPTWPPLQTIRRFSDLNGAILMMSIYVLCWLVLHIILVRTGIYLITFYCVLFYYIIQKDSLFTCFIIENYWNTTGSRLHASTVQLTPQVRGSRASCLI